MAGSLEVWPRALIDSAPRCRPLPAGRVSGGEGPGGGRLGVFAPASGEQWVSGNYPKRLRSVWCVNGISGERWCCT